ncbi:MAG: 4-(cytidine 5'-diphospho)-2-C-methyl-D-erythritol kinase [Clostridia bacterium]|nr:4-(cytidine 5'-diphospho)-2-C-methyl-D-erythritol kinase [Clostridia bacterium]
MKIQVAANAKINLSLDITGRREDGYHLIDTVMQSVTLCDTVTVMTDKSQKINVICNHPYAQGGKNNIAYKAAEAFFEYALIYNPGITIKIDKTIPVSAGLAGGSADGAAVICALNELCGAGLSEKHLCEIGIKVGADLPFCITGGTRRACGIGEEITTLPSLPDCFIVIAKPQIGVSTKTAYEKIDSAENLYHPDVERVINELGNSSVKNIARAMGNTFEVALALEPVLQIKKLMIAGGALGSIMSGSGSAVFGIFNEQYYAQNCCKILNNLPKTQAFVCRPSKKGVELR